ncbi:CDP-diacylglycerol--glycerol-3-phosphate 3-phosphatidyltransferase [Alkalibacterium sp. AK22]|uniref:CDP-alcohol phosphatidyltransferase family protein n=1 Tax=Alkalibacterium sp. AK22 TaxID=1229520 RepID=UPI00044F9E27|nr:CDP-alcohol phosphatidyltransferase family protein [Alkalibacterium sp. AK22]EXJ24180.1 CDP-diacylglycerol--glycerol-3-phosphate 3-phosphatidyltransferase [Alkalibacterium sp. AK22]
MNRKDMFTIPNILSYVRLLLIPVFVHAYLTAESGREFYQAGGILFFSGLTDALDGFIARRFNQSSQLGQLIDPIADKLTQLAVVGVLMIRWPVFLFLFLLFLFKESYMFIENIRLYRQGKTLDGAEWYGKIATIVFYVSMLLAVLLPGLNDALIWLIAGLASFFQLIAFYNYNRLFRAMHKM